MLTEPCADFIQAGHLSMSPPEYGMNLTNSIEAALAFEQDRREVPDGYPNLPDLPLARYNAPQLYRQEFATVWRRSWLFAGHTTELPQVGSYRVPDIPFAPVLLVRGEDGAIRAFLNACRHRGPPSLKVVRVVRDKDWCAASTPGPTTSKASWSASLKGVTFPAGSGRTIAERAAV
jgi:hypothetical protein